jgi:hypothetical protein
MRIELNKKKVYDRKANAAKQSKNENIHNEEWVSFKDLEEPHTSQ